MTKVRGNTVWLGIDAPRDVAINRQEVQDVIERERQERQRRAAS